MLSLAAALAAMRSAPLQAQTSWLAPVNGTWATAANWTSGVPGSGSDALINVTGGAYTVSQAGGGLSARTLTIDAADATLALSASATLSLSTTASSAFTQGMLTLNASNVFGKFTPASGFSALNTGGTSVLELDHNNGVLRANAGVLWVRGANRTLRPEWVNGSGALIEADGAAARVQVGETFSDNSNFPWRNDGQIVARNGGQVGVGGTTTARLGTLRIFDTARINITGYIDNAGATLTAPSGGAFDIANGSIVSGGSIAPGAIVLRPRVGSGTVGLDLKDGVVWQGDVAVFNNAVRFFPGATFSGTELNASGFFGATFFGPATVSGKAITLASTLPVTNAANKTTLTLGVSETGSATTVTFAADTSVSGNDFTLAGSNNGTFVNQGTIRHLSGSSGTSSLGTLSNTGTIRADAGFFSLAPGTLANTGILESRAGATLALAVSVFTQSATGELRGTGQINLNTPISGGVLRPGNDGAGNLGTLTVQSPFGQPATFTGPTTFAMEIDGANADQLFFNNGSKGVDLTAGNVSLSLTLLSAPTAPTYRIVNLPAGFQNLWTGTFAGLPHGAIVLASVSGTDYPFAVEYDSKGVTLRQVPASSAVTVTKTGTGSGSVVSQPAGIDCGATCSADFPTGSSATLTATPVAGSVFNGWSGGCAGTNPQCTLAAGAPAATASFGLVTYTLSIPGNPATGSLSISPGNIVCMLDCSLQIEAGTTVTVTPVPADKHAFFGYAGCPQSDAGLGSCTFVMNGNVGMNVDFRRVASDITITFAGMGSGRVTSTSGTIDCNATCTVRVPYGPNVTLNPGVAEAGSMFSRFFADRACNGPGACTVDSGSDRFITATFDLQAPTFTVTNANPTGPGSFFDITRTIYDAGNDVCLSGVKTIAFNIPAATDPNCDAASGICRIPLPENFELRCGSIIVNGYTQPGASPNTAIDFTNNAAIKIEFDAVIASPYAGRFQIGRSTTHAFGNIGASNVSLLGLAFPRHSVEIVTGNTGSILHGGSGGHVVAGNVFGWHADGSAAAGAVSKGISAIGAYLTNLTIGGSSPADRNLLTHRNASLCCEFGSRGIYAEGVESSTFQGNYINIDKNGAPVFTNGMGSGVTFSGGLSGGTPYPRNNLIKQNVVANVTGVPISTSLGSGNTVTQNLMFGHPAHLPGISVHPTNDGGQNPQVPPVVTSVAVVGGVVQLTGTVAAPPGEVLTLEAFSNAAAYMTNAGRADRYEGAVTATADSNGVASFTFNLPVFPSQFGPYSDNFAVTATRQSTGDTSMFSLAAAPLPTTLVSATPNGTGLGTTVSTQNAAILCGTTCLAALPQGSTVTLVASPALGSFFAGWTGPCAGSFNSTCSFVADGTMISASPIFTQGYFLTLKNSPDTILSPVGPTCPVTGADVCRVYTIGVQVLVGPPSKPGQTFLGWGGNGGCSGTNPCLVTMDQDRTLIAQFSTIQHLVTPSAGPGGVISPNTPQTVTQGSTATFTLIPTLAKHAVVGGTCGGTLVNNTFTTAPVTAACSVDATFVDDTYTITFNTTGNGHVSVSSPQVRTWGGFVDFAVRPDTGYTFQIGGTCTLQPSLVIGGEYSVVDIDEDCHVDVTFTFNENPRLEVGVAVLPTRGGTPGHVTSDPPGIDCTTTCVANFPAGTVVTLTAPDGPDTRFVEWNAYSGACAHSTSRTCTLTMIGNKFAGPTYQAYRDLTLDIVGGGQVKVGSTLCTDDCVVSIPRNDFVTLSIPATPGLVFTGWGGACSGTGSCTVRLLNALSVTANFDSATRTLTVVRTGNGGGKVTSVPAGIDCDVRVLLNAGFGSCTASFPTGTVVTLTTGFLAQDIGSLFNGWGDACAASGSATTCTVTMDQSKTATADYVSKPKFRMTVNNPSTGQGGTGTVTSSGGGISCPKGANPTDQGCYEDYFNDQTITLTATADDGSLFTGWGADCAGTSISFRNGVFISTCTLDMFRAWTAQANWLAGPRVRITGATGDGSGTVTAAPAGRDAAGIDCLVNGTAETNVCTAYPAIDEPVTLTAVPDVGSVLSGWTGVCASVNGFVNPTCTLNDLSNVNTRDLFTAPIFTKVLTLMEVVSRKTHGNAGDFDIVLNRTAPVSGNVSVEPRRDPTGLYRIFFTFNETITDIGGLTLRDKLQNPVGHATYRLEGNVVRVTLDSIPDETRLTIRLIDVNGSPQDFSVSMGFLAGDVSGNGTVTAADYLAARARGGPVTQSNFRADVNVEGTVNAIDQKTLRSKSGASLP